MIYENTYVLDTNIILNNANNFIELSNNGKNLIVLPETVMDEIDSKKSGLDEINFQARSFARTLYDVEIIDKYKLNDLFVVVMKVSKDSDVIFHTIAKNAYKSDTSNASHSIINDRKILEITKDISIMEPYKNLKFISLDVMARTRALTLGLDTEPLYITDDLNTDKDFHLKLDIPEFNGNIKDIPDVEDYVSSIEITNQKGNTFIYYKGKTWDLIPEKNTKRLSVPPINKRQKILSELILDKTSVVVASGPAGTGKTLASLSSAMRLIDLNRDVYNKIYYIRKTVISGDSQDELGFLPGSLDEKMQGYNQPMEDSLKKIVQLSKRSKKSKEDIEEGIAALKEKYDIEYLYAGHLRGSTLEEGSILIMDECQNWDITSIRTIISRVGKNSHIIALGSNNQIDTKYLTRNTNALTFLLNKCGSVNDSDVSIKGVKLTNVMRSNIAEWADKELY